MTRTKKKATVADTQPTSRMRQLSLFESHLAQEKRQQEHAHDALSTASVQTVHQTPEAYLKGLFGKWDGTPRIARVVKEVLYADDTIEHRQMVRRFFVNATRRALYPGCMVGKDFVLQGAHGIGKSQWLQALAGNWYVHRVWLPRTNEDIRALQNSWIVEAECPDSLSMMLTTSGANQLRAFCTKTRDIARKRYARVGCEYKRSFVGVFTVVDGALDKKVRGIHRRLDVLQAKRTIDVSWSLRWRDQLWAEAIVRAAEDGPLEA